LNDIIILPILNILFLRYTKERALIKGYNILKPNLLRLREGKISISEMTELVYLCRSVIDAYLNSTRRSITRLCLTQGLTITDLSYDCIAEIFARNEQNKFPQIENFTGVLREPLDVIPDNDLFLAFKQFLICITDAQLARLYAQSDPAGAKIHRNIRDTVKNSKLFRLERDFRGLILRPTIDFAEHLEQYPREELERALFDRIDHQITTPDLLNIIYTILIEQHTYACSIPLVDIVQIFKKVYHGDLNVENCSCDISSESLTQFEIDRVCSQIELSLKEKILLTYLARGKVDRKEAEAMFDTFKDLLEDWCNSEESQTSIFNYFKQYLPVTEEQYESLYRSKMEYLLKIAREEFRIRLMKEL
jgi:hypothetical protein